MPRPTLLLALSFLPLTACWVSEEEVTDLDGDGYTSTTGDCSENDPAISPGATELCDGIDNDCDGLVDDADAVSPGSLGSFYADVDADGFGGVTSVVLACAAPVGFVENATDCDDRLADVFPGAAERCNGRDDDCDQLVDDDDDNMEQSSMTTFHADSDGDDFGDPAVTLEACDAPRGYVDNDQDCDDDDHDTNPEADEVCDALDNDCDGATDDADPDVDTRTFGAWFADVDGDGFGDPDGLIETCAPAAGEVANAEDCDDAHAAAAPGLDEVPYDGLDNDCDARTDDDDLDGDGFPQATDCDDGDAAVSPAATERCGDGVDNDCNAESTCGTSDLEAADADVIFYGDSSIATYVGHSVSGAGDVNGDGLADIVIGAPSGTYVASGSGYSHLSGMAYVVTDAASASGYYALSASSARIQGTPTSASSPVRQMVGYNVAPFGDVDGDGMDEVAFAVEGSSVTTTTFTYTDGGQRASYIYSFSQSDAFVMPVGSGGELNIDSARLTTYQDAGDQPGNTEAGIATGGDLTGDGVADLVRWTWLARGTSSAGYTYESVTRVISGAATGHVGGSVEITLPDAYPSGAYYGLEHDPVVADVNGDGRSDLLVPGDGAAYVWYGPLAATESAATADVVYESPGLSAAVTDISGDGTPDVLFGGVMSPAGTTVRPVIAFYSGAYAGTLTDTDMEGHIASEITYVSAAPVFGFDLAAGDLNGDGAQDIGYSVCSRYSGSRYSHSYYYTYTNTYISTGAVFGSGSGSGTGSLLPSCAAMASSSYEYGVFTMSGPLAAGETPHGDAVAIHQYGGSDGSFGASIAVPGDVNGDGIDDLLVGDVNAYTTGAAYLFYGRPGE